MSLFLNAGDRRWVTGWGSEAARPRVHSGVEPLLQHLPHGEGLNGFDPNRRNSSAGSDLAEGGVGRGWRNIIARRDSIVSQLPRSAVPGDKFFHCITLTLALGISPDFPARRCTAAGRSGRLITPDHGYRPIYPLARKAG